MQETACFNTAYSELHTLKFSVANAMCRYEDDTV